MAAAPFLVLLGSRSFGIEVYWVIVKIQTHSPRFRKSRPFRLIRPPTLDCPKADFSGTSQGDGLVTPPDLVSTIGTLLSIALCGRSFRAFAAPVQYRLQRLKLVLGYLDVPVEVISQ